MPLTDREVKQAKPRERAYKLGDARGLYCLVQPNGSKLWRAKYRFRGTESTASYGPYPEVSLRDARDAHDESRRLLRAGVNPNTLKRVEAESTRQTTEETVEAIGREWFAKRVPNWKESSSSKIKGRLKTYIYPQLGRIPVRELDAPAVLALCSKIHDDGKAETARRCLQVISQIMRFAVQTGRASIDPTAALRGALPPSRVRHHPAITEPKALGAFLRAADAYDGTLFVKCALRMTPHVFVRPGELRRAEWAEIDVQKAEWIIPASKMKGGDPHIVPLSKQVLAILEEIAPTTGRGRYVFPGRTPDRPLSENGISAALVRMDYSRDHVTPHGFRATARTLLDQELGFAPQVIEHQLAHSVPDVHGRAYNRTRHLKDRRRMMQRWSDYLDELRERDRGAS